MNSHSGSRLSFDEQSVLKRPVEQEAVSNGVFWLYIYFLIDFFMHLSQRIPGYGAPRPTLILALIISIMLFMQKRQLNGYGSDLITKGIITLIIYIAVTLPLVEWPGSVIKNNLPSFVKAVVFFFFTSLIIDSERRLRIFLVVFISCQTFRVLEPLYLNITQGYWGSYTHLGGADFAGRLAGSPYDVINPNELGFVIVTLVPFLHYLLLGQRNTKSKILYLVLTLLLGYALLLTMSRGAVLALIVIGWMIFKESKNKGGIIIMSVIFMIAAYSVMTPVQKDRYFGMFSPDSASSRTVDGRLDLIKKEFMLGLNRPIIGHGVGTTPEAKTHTWGNPQASHNMYGELLIEVGFIGTFIFVQYMLRISRRMKENSSILLSVDKKDPPVIFVNLNNVFTAIFWMYILYSLNYWGLSQYYWYLLGGMVIAYGRLLNQWQHQHDQAELNTGAKATIA